MLEIYHILVATLDFGDDPDVWMSKFIWHWIYHIENNWNRHQKRVYIFIGSKYRANLQTSFYSVAAILDFGMTLTYKCLNSHIHTFIISYTIDMYGKTMFLP